MRIDKWLWAARFYKTRSLATQAVEAGKVKLNGERIKPAKEIKPGDPLSIRIGDVEWSISVRALSMQRRSAPEAQQLYEESVEARAKRLDALALRKQTGTLREESGRPTKRDRRMIRRFTGDA
ncbi:MAG TPA: RNA-binding S4 domain-containing protein [Burkholderiales bacterium]|nr:RNA-binding S4 domain-containing protein [Burkholderiales bacterium]